MQASAIVDNITDYRTAMTFFKMASFASDVSERVVRMNVNVYT